MRLFVLFFCILLISPAALVTQSSSYDYLTIVTIVTYSFSSSGLSLLVENNSVVLRYLYFVAHTNVSILVTLGSMSWNFTLARNSTREIDTGSLEGKLTIIIMWSGGRIIIVADKYSVVVTKSSFVKLVLVKVKKDVWEFVRNYYPVILLFVVLPVAWVIGRRVKELTAEPVEGFPTEI